MSHIFSRKVIEDIARYGRHLSRTRVVQAGKKLPGYETYVNALRSQVSFLPINPQKGAR